MKRAWTKKVKAVPASAVGNDALERHLKPFQLKVKRRVRTSAAMIGLVISMGAPNLLLTQQSDRTPAAEPVGNEPTVSTVPAAEEVNLGGGVNSVAREAAKSVPEAASSSTVVPPTPRMQVEAAVSPPAPPAPPVLEYKVQKGQTLRQLSQKYQGNAAASATRISTIAPSNSLPKRSDLQAEKVLKTRRVSRLVQKLKANKIETPSKPYEFNRNSFTPPAAPVVTQQLKAEESQRVSSETNGGLTAKQRILINRLKQKPNRLKDSLAELRSEESNSQKAPTTNSGEYFSAIEKVQPTNQPSFAPTVVKPTVGQQQAAEQSPEVLTPGGIAVFDLEKPLETPDAAVVVPDVPKSSQTTNQPSFAPTVVKPTVGQQQAAEQSPEVVTLDGIAVFDLEKPPETPDAAVVVPDVPTSTVNELNVAVVSVSPDYQVRAGDTLSSIARRRGVSLSELVNANQLSDPNRIQINQRLRIPTFQYSSAVGPTLAVIKRVDHPDTTVSTIAVSTPSEPLTATPSVYTAYTGMGGSISDENDESPSTFEETQLARATAVKTKPQPNQYIQGLQTDIQRLRQKYYAQQTSSQVVPVENETATVATLQIPAPATKTIRSEAINLEFRPHLPANQPINPEFRVAQAAKTLQPAVQKRSPTQPKSKARVATVPIGVDASKSLEPFTGRRVSPELPPLGTVDTYLPKPSSASAPFKGYIWPAKGALTSGYGWRWGRMHKGIDVAAPIGTPIVASAPGVVVKAGWNSGGYGKLVELRHPDGTLTRYAHNNRILVRAGQQVEQGQRISEMGSTGFSTGPHLHFEVHPGGKGAVNPIALLPRSR